MELQNNPLEVAEKGQHQSQKPPVPPNKSYKVNWKIIPKPLTSKKVGMSNGKGKGSGSSGEKRKKPTYT